MKFETIPRRRRELRPNELPVGDPSRQIDAKIKWLVTWGLTDFVTVILNQAIVAKTAKGVVRVRYRPENYNAIAERFQRKLSAKLLGKAYRRFGTLIHGWVSLEGGANDWGQNCGDYHLHILLKRPEHVTPERFSNAILDFWQREPATKQLALNTAVRIDPICPQTIARLASYLSKQGPSGLVPLPKNLSQ